LTAYLDTARGDTVMVLTDAALRKAKPGEKPYKMSDEKGLYILVKPAGKYFRFDYRFDGKRKTLAVGVYPEVKLKEARRRCEDARRLLADGIDPLEQKKVAKTVRTEEATNSFQTIALEWFAKNKHTWTQGHSKTIIRRLEANVFPWLGSRPVAGITASELLAVLRRVETRGAVETAHRIKQICSQVFRYTIATIITDSTNRKTANLGRFSFLESSHTALPVEDHIVISAGGTPEGGRCRSTFPHA
jgi:hypothetical protein